MATFLLTFSVSGGFQLCKHQSGSFHIFTDLVCDGEREHDENHDHGHKDDHSQHHTSNEHHEPCSHDLVIKDAEFAGTNEPITISLPVLSAIIPRSDIITFKEVSNKEYCFSNILNRGPPGKDSPCSHFASSIRLLI